MFFLNPFAVLQESLQGEPTVLQGQWGECSRREEALARQLQEQTDLAVLEAQDLRAFLERDRLRLRSLELQKVPEDGSLVGNSMTTYCRLWKKESRCGNGVSA